MTSKSKAKNRRRRIVQDTGEEDITNNENLSYTYSVFMGSQIQELTVLPDTGSDWLAVVSSSCSNCTTANTFDDTASTTFIKLSGTSFEQAYGSADLYGYKSSDSVYLDKAQSFGLTSFDFMLVTEGVGLVNYKYFLNFDRETLPELTATPGTLTTRATRMVPSSTSSSTQAV